MDSKRIAKNLTETRKVALEFADLLKPGDIVFLQGEMGAGKTSFVQGVFSYFDSLRRVISPTFVILKSYEIDKNGINYFNHIDLYRIENETDIQSLGLEEILYEKNSVSFIEWPERISMIKNSYIVHIKKLDNDTREINIRKI